MSARYCHTAGGSPKVTHATVARARRSAEEFGDPTLSVYRCPTCGGWHIGHERIPRRTARRLARRKRR